MSARAESLAGIGGYAEVSLEGLFDLSMKARSVPCLPGGSVVLSFGLLYFLAVCLGRLVASYGFRIVTNCQEVRTF